MALTLKQLNVFSVLRIFVSIMLLFAYFKSNNSFVEKILNTELSLSLLRHKVARNLLPGEYLQKDVYLFNSL